MPFPKFYISYEFFVTLKIVLIRIVITLFYVYLNNFFHRFMFFFMIFLSINFQLFIQLLCFMVVQLFLCNFILNTKCSVDITVFLRIKYV